MDVNVEELRAKGGVIEVKLPASSLEVRISDLEETMEIVCDTLEQRKSFEKAIERLRGQIGKKV